MEPHHPSPTRVIVNGAPGRVGSLVCAAARDDARFELVAALCSARSSRLGAPVFADARGGEPLVFAHETGVLADVVIDFSTDEGTRCALETARNAGAALLVGTTALRDATRDALRAEAESRAVLIAPNTSVGVTVLAKIVEEISSALGGRYRCAIVETHHMHKTDAPSGTALRLAEAARAHGADLDDEHILAMRIGDIVGEHTVRFAGDGEVLELTHRATSRMLFARGALRAAAWLHGRSPGLWTMQDCVETPGR